MVAIRLDYFDGEKFKLTVNCKELTFTVMDFYDYKPVFKELTDEEAKAATDFVSKLETLRIQTSIYP